MTSDTLIVTRLMWPGGVFRAALEESRHMPAKLIVLRRSNHDTPYDMNGVDIEVIRDNGKRGFFTPIFEILTLFYDKERGRDATIDLDLIFQMRDIEGEKILYMDQFVALAGLLNLLLHGKQYYVFLHETVLGRQFNVKNLPLIIYDKLILKHAKMVITNSKWNQRILASYGMKSTVAHLGCNPTEKLNLVREPLIITVSMWDRFRRPEIYVELAKRINAKVLIVGNWTRDDYKDEFIEKFGSVVKVTGPLNEDELGKLYDQASFYIRFGYGERGPGLGGIEALGHGLPVITNKGLGISELIDDGKNGFIVDDIEEAASKINSVLSDKNRHLDMIKNAWEKGKELSWENHAAKVRNILNCN